MLDTLTIADLVAAPGAVDLARVRHEFVINTTPERLLQQTRHNLARGLPEFNAQIPDRGWCGHTLSLCGSAPSLMRTLPEIRGDVMAVNGAILALTRAGVRVDYPMIWDATPEMVRYARAISGAEWLIASRVHPSVIDRLLELGQRVTLWHAATSEPEMLAVYGTQRMQVFGGRTGATRGPFLAGAMGYRNLHLFGADASYSAETHIGGSVREEKEVLSSFEGEVYRTTFWMMDQAESWVTFVLPELVPTGMWFTVHGDGLLPAAHRSWLRQCLPWRQRLKWRLLA